MSSPIPSGFDPQASLDAALLAAAGGSSTSSSDPAVGALDSLGSSYADEISFLQQQLVPATGAYDSTGAVAGGFAGNAVESNNNGRAYNAWRFYVQLDDGRNAAVTQYDNPGFRPGDRVAIRHNHLVMLR